MTMHRSRPLSDDVEALARRVSRLEVATMLTLVVCTLALGISIRLFLRAEVRRAETLRCGQSTGAHPTDCRVR